MKEILLNKFRNQYKIVNYALVDNEDYEWLNQYSWSVSRQHNSEKIRCVTGSIKMSEDKSVRLFFIRCSKLMHRIIMARHGYNIYGFHIDHIDRNPLNNQKSNLRVCTHKENMWNRVYYNSNSIYQGVYFENGFYIAKITVNGKCVRIGKFTNEINAAKAWNEAVFNQRGEFAVLNVFKTPCSDIEVNKMLI